jgi:hypothetical protein
MTHLNASLSQEIKRAVAGLPFYNEGPGVDFTNAPVAYAVNITVVHMPGYNPAFIERFAFSVDTRARMPS